MNKCTAPYFLDFLAPCGYEYAVEFIRLLNLLSKKLKLNPRNKKKAVLAVAAVPLDGCGVRGIDDDDTR